LYLCGMLVCKVTKTDIKW